MSEVTRILSAIEEGDPHAAEQLLPLVYHELRQLAAQRLAKEKLGQTLDATGLVHEAYLRLVDVDQAQLWDSRAHFFAAAAEATRRILIDASRAKASAKRGGAWKRIDFNRADLTTASDPDDLLMLNDALEKLARSDGEAAQLVKLRFFAGMSVEKAGELLGLSRSSAYERWIYSRAWLYSELQDQPLVPAR